jgi:hypothetical protein
MNKEPKPEYPHDDCMHCEQKYHLATGNTYIFEYTDMPDAVHLCAICPHCSAINTIFIASEGTREHFEQFGYGVHKQAVPNFEVMEAYLNLYEIPTVEQQELTPRKDARVQWLGYLLTNDKLTLEDFENGNAELLI